MSDTASPGLARLHRRTARPRRAYACRQGSLWLQVPHTGHKNAKFLLCGGPPRQAHGSVVSLGRKGNRGKRARRHQGTPPPKTASHEKEELLKAQTSEPQLADILDFGAIAESFLLLSRGGSLRVVLACADCGLDQLVHAQVSRQSGQTVAVPCEPVS